MRHDWILDVLADLHAYALANDLPDLALKVAETLAEARQMLLEGEEPSLHLPMSGLGWRGRGH